ncbi:MAG: ATP-binding protein [Candidatus Dormibacteria bacterium]|jgi:signal transduction histidine kinase/ActR/RegA family two-component response regulator
MADSRSAAGEAGSGAEAPGSPSAGFLQAEAGTSPTSEGATLASLQHLALVENLQRLIPQAVESAAKLARADYAALALLRPESPGYGEYHETDLTGAVTRLPSEDLTQISVLEVLRSERRAIGTGDPRLSSALDAFPPGRAQAAAFLATPVKVGAELFGHLLLARERPESFSKADAALAGELARVVALAARRQRAEEQSVLLRSQNQRLVRANLALVRQLRPTGVLQWLVNDLRTVADAQVAAIFLLDKPGGEVGSFVYSGLTVGHRSGIEAVQCEATGILGFAMHARRPMRLDDLRQHPSHRGFPPGHPVLTSFVSAPILRQRQEIGLVYAANKRRSPAFTELDERFVDRVAAELGRSPGMLTIDAPAPELVDRIAAATGALRREMEATRFFLSSLSHELRGSISGIMVSSELLADRSLGALEEPQLRALGGRIHAVAGNLLVLVDNLLDLGRLEAGRLDVRLQPVDLSTVIDEVTGVISPLAETAQVTVEWPNIARVPRVLADPIRLRQVLVNLFTNAVKFTPAGGRAWLELEPTEKSVRFSVCDTGRGIPPAETERIFTPFARGGDSEVPGVGLGLAICKHIVELHGGRLEVSSELGVGSRFSFTLRRSREPLPPRLLRAPGGATVVAGADGRPAAVLLVEDDPVNRQSIGDVLTAVGYRVRSVGTRAAALEAMAKKPADVVVLDVQLSDGNGLEIVGSMRSAVDRPVAIVALSADRIGNTAERAMAVGCDRFGLKPIPARDLLALVVEALEERRTLYAPIAAPPG